jgi:Cu2+-exporting ATPase
VTEECIHCKTPLEPSQKESGFCCTGCEFVHQLIHNEGLDKFYDLKQGEISSPLRDQPFQQYDFSWLKEKIHDYEENSPDSVTTEFKGSLQGISCIGCVWLVEKLFLRHPGGVRCDIVPTTGVIHLTWKRNDLDILDFAQELQRFGYLIGPPRASQKQSGEFSQLGGRLGICAAFALNGMVFSLPRYLGMPADFAFAGIFNLIIFVSATLSMLVGGSWFIKRAVQGVRAGIIHMDLPIALGVSLAYLGSLLGWLWNYEELMYFDFVAIFIFLMLGGRWLQTAAVERNRNRLLEQTPVPLSVNSAKDGEAIEIDAIEKDLNYHLPVGQTAPVSSVIAEGSADFSLEWINGEPDPIHRSTGMQIPAGAINLSDSQAILTAEEDWQDSLLAKLIRPGEATARSPVMEKILSYYLAAVLVLGLGGGIGWLLAGMPIAAALQVTISVFVISCPCALGVALPLADELASGRMRVLGVFIRRPAFWSRIKQIKTLFFDKTGTLTLELPQLLSAQKLSALDDPTASALSLLCAGSRHPLSRSLMRALGMRGQSLLSNTAPQDQEELPGLGHRFHDIDHRLWSLGKCGWDGKSSSQTQATRPGCELRCDGKLISYFEFHESLRPEAQETLQLLADHNPHILSGDHTDRVQQIADLLGIEASRVHAGLSPENKATIVQEIDPEGSLFLGDGANDSLAFDASFMTGAVAGRGVLEAKADFYFLSNGLQFLPKMFLLAKKYSFAVRSVFTFSLSYNLIAVAICLAGHMNPLIAAILMPLSSLVSLGIISFILPVNTRSNDLIAKLPTPY